MMLGSSFASALRLTRTGADKHRIGNRRSIENNLRLRLRQMQLRQLFATSKSQAKQYRPGDERNFTQAHIPNVGSRFDLLKIPLGAGRLDIIAKIDNNAAKPAVLSGESPTKR